MGQGSARSDERPAPDASGDPERRWAREPLTPRERQVVELLALGHTGPEIAAELVLSHDTVRTHVRNAMEKAGARTRAHLVAIVFADGDLTGRVSG
jgi:DNA-binding NarL/FixJ family response regulator